MLLHVYQLEQTELAFFMIDEAGDDSDVDRYSPSTTSTRRIVATPFGIDLPFIQYDVIHIIGRLGTGDARIIGTRSNPKTLRTT